MRRIIAAAAVGAALFALAACADVPQPERDGKPPQSQSNLADKKTVCDAYLKLDTEVEGKITSLAVSVQAAQNDPLKAASALSEGMTVLSEYQAKTSDLATRSADAELKAALQAEVDTTKKLQADLTAAGSDPAKVQSVIQNADRTPGEKLESLCR